MLYLDSKISGDMQRISCFDSKEGLYGVKKFHAFPNASKNDLISRVLIGKTKAGLELLNSVWLLHDLSHTLGIQVLTTLQPNKSQHIFSAKAEYLTVALTNRLFPDMASLRIILPFGEDYIFERQTLKEADTLLLTAEIIVSAIIENNSNILKDWRVDLDGVLADFSEASRLNKREFTLKVPQRRFEIDIDKCLSKIAEVQQSILRLNSTANTGKFIRIEESGELQNFITQNGIALNDRSFVRRKSSSDKIGEGSTLKRLETIPLYSDPTVTASEILETFLNLKTFGSRLSFQELLPRLCEEDMKPHNAAV